MSEDLQLGRGVESPEPGGEGRRRCHRTASRSNLRGSVDVLLCAVGSYRLETYLGELTYPGEPRRRAVTASESQRFQKAEVINANIVTSLELI